MVRAHSLRFVRPFVLSGLAFALIAMPADAGKKKESPVPPVQDEPALLTYLAGRAAACYDSTRGGFVGRNGVPRASAVRLGFLLSQDDPDNPWHDRAIATLDWTLSLRDTVGGGFLHAADDQALDIPSFHKRTDSNAERLELLLQGFEVTGDPVYRNHAAQVVDYFQRVLLDGRGGFVAGQSGDRDLIPEANGYAIRAWCAWAVATADPRVRSFAYKSVDQVWAKCWEDGVGLLRKDNFGEVIETPQLIDQVEMGRALVMVASIGNRESDRARAAVLGDLLLGVWEDKEKGGFATHAKVDDKGRVKNSGRDSYANAQAALFLAELATLTGEEKYRDGARRAIAVFTPEIEKPDFEAADWALAVRALSIDDRPEAPNWAAIAERDRTPAKSRRYNTRRR
jgi:uncharacterized protein YyaL (SSP411 family)